MTLLCRVEGPPLSHQPGGGFPFELGLRLTELALGALRATESQLGRLIVREEGRESFFHIGPPDQPALNTAWDLNELIGSHGRSLGPRERPLHQV